MYFREPTAVLTTGNQLKAARSLIGVEQAEVAELAGVNVNTIRSMEGAAADPIAGRAENVQKVQRVLENKGVEFLNHGQPGVRLKAKPAEDPPSPLRGDALGQSTVGEMRPPTRRG